MDANQNIGTLLVAIFGAATGFAGLVLHFWKFIQERPSINVFRPLGEKGKTITAFDEHEDDMCYCEGEVIHRPDETKLRFWLWLRITNTSEKPLTILEFTLSLPGLEDLVFNSETWAPKIADQVAAFDGDEYKVFENTSVQPIIKPIFTIESYKAIEGYIHFGPVDTDKLKPSEGVLKINTSRKVFSTGVSIDPIFPSLGEIQKGN